MKKFGENERFQTCAYLTPKRVLHNRQTSQSLRDVCHSVCLL